MVSCDIAAFQHRDQPLRLAYKDRIRLARFPNGAIHRVVHVAEAVRGEVV